MILDKSAPEAVGVLPFRYGRLMVIARDKYIGQAIRDYGEYSEGEIELWRALLKPTSIVADVGANIGAHTVALAQLVHHGLVMAFEPVPYLYNVMCGNVALNGLTNVLPRQCAVGASRGTINVPGIDYTAEANYGGLALGNFLEGNPVNVFPLDEMMPRVDFIKIDVEGMEEQVFAGAQRLIQTFRPILYFENNPGSDGELASRQQSLTKLVQEMGYDVWWHVTPLYNPDNFLKNPVNHYGEVGSFNQIAIPSHPDNGRLGLGPPCEVK